ncbi:C-X-C motif chemokine 10-like [Echeneis naucrates]|uniref:C-X-C motif chemokine 10-like n=1 Tax=Echeneis naucrates TaxID=173247 RepID=A0A665USV0_ECHNA|nr:C-X-C motif chemokine 10-like [Echeneis naucrates]
MSGIIKVFLLLAVVVSIAKSQRTDSGEQCLCQRVKNAVPNEIKDIQIYPATIFCDKVEIVVTTNNGRFCLNPNNKMVKNFLVKILKSKKASTTVKPAHSTSTANN